MCVSERICVCEYMCLGCGKERGELAMIGLRGGSGGAHQGGAGTGCGKVVLVRIRPRLGVLV